MMDDLKKYYPTGAQIGEFPWQAFPKPVQNLLQLAYDNENFPPEIFAAAILAAVSASIGNSLTFKNPMGWTSKPSLWLCIMAPRGSTKTPAISAALKPIYDLLAIQHSEHSEKLKVWETTDQTEPRPEFYPGVFGESTLEGVVKACEKNPGGVLTDTDEMAGFIESFGRYNGGGDMDGYNSLWNGKTTIVNRKKASLSMYVENPFWTLIGGLQPTRTGDQFGSKMVESGFLDRFQFVYPKKSSLEPLDMKLENAGIMERHWLNYKEQVTTLIKQAAEKSGYYIRPADPQRWLDRYNFFNQFRQNGIGETDPIRGLSAKAQTMFGRLCVVVHGMSVAFDKKGWMVDLTESEIEAAFDLTSYFFSTGLHTYYRLGEASPVDILPDNKRRLYESLTDEFDLTTKEVEAANKKLEKSALSRSTLQRFLKDIKYFKKMNHGLWAKIH